MRSRAIRAVLSACVFSTMCVLAPAACAEPLRLEIADASPGFEERSRVASVTIKLKDDSRAAFGRLTAVNIGRKLEFRIDGKTVMRPIVRGPILGGTLQISGGLTLPEVADLVARLKSGAAKVEVEIVAD